jgi:acyl carrier protein
MTVAEMDRLVGVVSNALGLAHDDARTASVDRVENWDSLTHLNLLMAIEEEFAISFDADRIPELCSFDRIAGAIDDIRRGGGD